MPPADVNSARRRRARLGAVLTLPLLLLACGPKETAPPPAPQKIEPPPPEPPKIIPPPPTLGRADLLAAAAAAASAYAAGATVERSDPLTGRSFAIRTPFGCAAAEDPPAPGLAGRVLRAKGRAAELSLTPADWTASPLVAAAVEAKIWDAVEGYWIDRPWLRPETCPALAAISAQDAEDAPAPSPQTVGLAAAFGPEGSRFGRRNGRAYSFTVRGEGEAPPPTPAKGYRLVLEGRFTAFPDGASIHCRAETPDRRPLCIAAAQLDRVAFEDGDTGGVISEWRKD